MGRMLLKRCLPGGMALALAAAVLCASLPLTAMAQESERPPVVVAGKPDTAAVDFNAKVSYADLLRYSLTRVEQLKSAQYDIETAKLGEKDVFYKMFPKLYVLGTYSAPINPDSSTKAYLSLSANSGTYDPLVAYYGRRPAKMAVYGAKLMHALAIQKYMEHLGLAFVSFMNLDEVLACQQEIVNTGTTFLAYVKERHEQGAVSQLDVLIAEQKLALARQALNNTTAMRRVGLGKLQRQLGISDVHTLLLDLPQSAQQLLGVTEPEAPVSFTRHEPNSLEKKLMAVDEELQRSNIKVAQADYIPRVSLGVTAPDPLSTQKSSSVYYAQIGLTVPVWTWGETARNVERAEIGTRRAAANRAAKMKQLQDEWDDLNLEFVDLRERFRIAETQRSIREMELQRAGISYAAGTKPMQEHVEAKLALELARIEAIKARGAYQQARVKLRARSGELLRELIQVDYGDMEKD